jgi:hypothetical protein
MRPVFDRLEQLGITPGRDEAPAPAGQATLTEEVVRRAAALRQAWADNGGGAV